MPAVKCPVCFTIIQPEGSTMREPILVEREATHGSFRQNAALAQALKYRISREGRWESLDARQREAIDLICTKLARIMTGNPNEKDHWKDIAGYAKLGEEACT